MGLASYGVYCGNVICNPGNLLEKLKSSSIIQTEYETINYNELKNAVSVTYIGSHDDLNIKIKACNGLNSLEKLFAIM